VLLLFGGGRMGDWKRNLEMSTLDAGFYKGTTIIPF